MAKNLLITGGASGIGAQTARRAAARGYRVVINYRSRAAQAEAVVADIVRSGGHAVALPGDMARSVSSNNRTMSASRAMSPGNATAWPPLRTMSATTASACAARER